MSHLIEEFKRIRVEINMSHRELSRKTGFDRQIFGRWEKYIHDPILFGFETALNAMGYELVIRKINR